MCGAGRLIVAALLVSWLATGAGRSAGFEPPEWAYPSTPRGFTPDPGDGKPKRLAGLTLLIMIAVLVASLIEVEVRHWIASTVILVSGLKPEGRDNAHPTAEAILRAFADYALVVIRHEDGRETVHYPKLRPVQQQLWEILKCPPLPTQPLLAPSGK